MDPARQLAQVAEEFVQLVTDAGQVLVDLAQVRGDRRRGGTQPQGE